MTNGEVNESLLVSQASRLIAETITEIEKLRAGCEDRSVYPRGIGNISVCLKNGSEAVELEVGSPPEALPPPQPLQAKLTMVYTITPVGSGVSSSTARITDANNNPITLSVDGKQHSVQIAG